MDIGLEFDNISSGYTEKIARWVPYYYQMIGSLVQGWAPWRTPGRILDLGAGNGNVTALLIQRFPEAEYVLVDASPEMIANCRDRFRGHPGMTFHLGYFQDVDFPPMHFDLVVAGLALHHLWSHEKQVIFHRIHTWLAGDGHFVCTDLFVDKDEEPGHTQVLEGWKRDATALGTTEEEWEWLVDHYQTYDHPDSWTNQEQWLRTAGFFSSLIWQKEAWGTFLAQKA